MDLAKHTASQQHIVLSRGREAMIMNGVAFVVVATAAFTEVRAAGGQHAGGQGTRINTKAVSDMRKWRKVQTSAPMKIAT